MVDADAVVTLMGVASCGQVRRDSLSPARLLVLQRVLLRKILGEEERKDERASQLQLGRALAHLDAPPRSFSDVALPTCHLAVCTSFAYFQFRTCNMHIGKSKCACCVLRLVMVSNGNRFTNCHVNLKLGFGS